MIDGLGLRGAAILGAREAVDGHVAREVVVRVDDLRVVAQCQVRVNEGLFRVTRRGGFRTRGRGSKGG